MKQKEQKLLLSSLAGKSSNGFVQLLRSGGKLDIGGGGGGGGFENCVKRLAGIGGGITTHPLGQRPRVSLRWKTSPVRLGTQVGSEVRAF